MITDTLGRSFKKLRVSLTHECNYACLYCSDKNENNLQQPNLPNQTISTSKKVLSIPEMVQIISTLHAELNLQMIRITGGEPLLHPQLENFISGINALGIHNIGITTNGHLLYNKVEYLKKAGLKSVNISLDALAADTFKVMSRYSGLPNVLKSINAAINYGLEVKINTVILKDKNCHQILPLLTFAMENGIVIRFLELMAMGPLHNNYNQLFFSENEIVNIISSKYKIIPIQKEVASTAHYWSINGKKAFGIIANNSTPFCSDCNRLRLDSFGNIYGCLSNLNAIKIDTNTTGNVLKNALFNALQHKQQKHFVGNNRTMQSIGG